MKLKKKRFVKKILMTEYICRCVKKGNIFKNYKDYLLLKMVNQWGPKLYSELIYIYK